MKKITLALCLIFTLSLAGCTVTTTENNSLDTEKLENISTKNNDSKVLESDGILEPMYSNELISKLAALYAGMSINEVSMVFGKEPFDVKETNSYVFKYFSGDITITLWGTELYQATVEYNDSIVMLSLGNETPLE